MNPETAHPAAEQREEAKLDHRILKGFFTAAWIAPAAALLVVVLFLVLGRIQLSETGRKYILALVYSAAIGLPSAVLLNWCSFRYTSRFPRAIVLWQILILLFTATAGCFAAGIVFQLTGVLQRWEFWLEFWGSYPFSIVITLLIGMSMTTFMTMRYRLNEATLELRTRELEQERATKLLAEARLSSLESRIHPHFLFNTLNSISALIPSDPRRAEETVGKLASLLRFSLSANPSGLVPLSQELKVVRDYLEIEQTRFGTRLRFTIDAPEELGSVPTPPLALQTLAENAVKHVASARAEGAEIRIAARRANASVTLEVLDDGPGFSLASITPEHGLGNLSERLELLFGSAGKLDVTREGGMTAVRITLPG
ncbi:MAG: histidine kinase [Terracidiphilus sp.]